MQRLKPGLLCLMWLMLAGAVSAQTSGDPASSGSAGVATLQNFSGGGVLNGTYFDIRHVVGDGVGYQNSYTQIGIFTPIWINEDTIFAPNVRLIATNSQQTGANLGAVGRRYVYDLDRIFGVYGYYDNDQDNYNFRYNQFTVGAETLGNWWDMRANGYFITGMNNNAIAPIGITGGPYYAGNAIAFVGQQLRDGAYSGGDAEVGAPMSPYTQWLRAYAGAYGYQTGNSGTVGFRGRIEATVSSDLSLGVMVSQDALWGTNVNGVIDFKFSGFLPTRYFPNWTTRQRMLNPVNRNWRISTHTYVKQVEVDAINPLTDKPYYITHVDNSAAVGGNGTIEHPYQHLQSSPPADIILVHLGNANSAATAVTGSAVLTDNQRLLGTGILSTAPLLAQYGGSTISGTFALPDTSNSGLYPYVTGPGNLVTLANNNEVAGLNFVNAGGSAIVNTAAGSNNFNLHNLEITGNAGYGVNLVNASGSGVINSINAGTTDHANPLGIGNNALGGIQVASGAPGLNLQLSNVSMNSNPAASQAFGVSLIANNGYLNANFNNIFANMNTGAGILLSETGQGLAANLNSVQANQNGTQGVQVSGTGGSINLIANDLAAIGNAGDNLQIGTQAAPITNAVVHVDLQASSFSNSTGGNGVVFSGSGTYGTLNMTSSAFGNAVNGLSIFATNSSLMNATVTNSNFTNNGNSAFSVNSNTGSTVNLVVDPTNASGSGNDGLYYNIGQNSTFNATFLNDNLNYSGNSAAYGLLSNFATANLYFNQTTGQNSGANGFYLNATNNSSANINIQDGSFQNSGLTVAGSSAVNIASNNSTVNILTDNTLGSQPANFSFGNNNSPNGGAVGTQAYGLTLNLQNNSIFQGAFENGGFSNNLTNAVNANVTSGSNAALTLYNSNGNNSGADGFVANVNNANLVVNNTLSSYNNSGGNGANVTVANGGSLVANINASTINNSGAVGLLANVTGAGSTAIFNLTNGSNINSSANSGVSFNVNAGTLNFNDTSDTISNNGLGGVSGSGVLGVVSNAGTANLNFLNVTINNNLDNGVFVTTNTGANVNASFDLGSVSNNGVVSPNAATNFNDGIRLVMDNATASSLAIQNGVAVNSNGSNGVTISASNGTTFNGVFDNSSIANNGASTTLVNQGAGLSVTANTNSNVNLGLSGMKINNTAAGGKQQYGLLTASSNSATINAVMRSSNLSNNAVDAINQSAVTLSTNSLTLRDTVADNSGATGALFNVGSGGISNFSDFSSGATNTASISSSGGSGILVFADGTGSVANFNVDGLNLNANGLTFGGQGFFGLASNGANLNAFIANTTILGNANQGIEINAVGANTVSRFNLLNTGVTNSGSEGLLINVANQATSYYRSINSQYSNNGSNGTLDGVSITATGNGALNSATAISLFSGDTIDANTGNGFTLNASNGATLTTSMQNVDVSNNGGFGIDATADNNANTQFALLMSGTNTLNNNTSGALNALSFSGINQLVLQLSGTFSNPTGDGVHVDATNIANVEVAVQGPGTIDNSGGNGIFVSLNTVTNGSVLVSGFSEINNSKLDGIDVTFNTVSNGAIQIEGPTNINGSGGDAVDVNLTNSTLVQGSSMTFGGSTLKVLTLTNNLATVTGNAALDNLLPDPVTVNLNALGITPAKALTIDGISATGSTQNGIAVVATGTNIAANGTFITNNTVAGATAGDGVVVNLTNGSADGMLIYNNVISGAGVNGLQLGLNNTPITGLTIAGNTIGSATAINKKDGVRLDLTNSTLTNLYTAFNIITSNGSNGIEFSSPSGNVVSSDIINAVFSSNAITNNAGDGVRLVNPTPAVAANPVSVVFNDNTITGNTGGGVNLDLLSGAQNLNSTFAGNTISGNTGGAGVNVQLAANTTMNGVFGANTISTNGAQGVNLAGNTSVVLNESFKSNVINGNTSDGIKVTLGTGGHFNDSAFFGNTIGSATSKNGGMGVRLVAPNGSSFNWNLGDSAQAANVIGGDTGAGVGILMTGSAAGTLNVQNTTFRNTAVGADPNFTGQGLGVILHNTATLNNSTIGSLNAVNSVATNNVTFSSNAGAGLSIFGDGNSHVTNLMITNVNSTSNSGDGIDISRIGAPIFNNITIQNSQVNSNNGIGISLLATNQLSTDSYTLQNNTISSNGSDGVRINVKFDAEIAAALTNNQITNNTGNGVNVIETANTGTDNRFVSGTWTGNTITGNSQNGIAISARSGINIGDTGTQIGNVIDNNGFNGIAINGVGSTSSVVTVIAFNDISGNGSKSTGQFNTNGVFVNAVFNDVIIVSDTIDSNKNDGVQLLGNNGASLAASIDHTLIGGNGQDAVAINTSGQLNQSPVTSVNVIIGGTSTTADNVFFNNGGRGVNILNQNQGNANITVENTSIVNNGLQGIYIVNTASADNTLNSSQTLTNLAANGSYFDHAQMALNVNNNLIENNGFSATGGNFADTTGLFLLVGTNGATTNPLNPGGFASTASGLNSLASAILTGNGGVLAQINNNTFGGNAGHDVGFQSFNSTDSNMPTGTTWTDGNAVPPDPTKQVFNASGYVSDPLARLDLAFTGNTGQDASVTRSGAFYNNSDGVFKSRLQGPPATVSPGGPFTSATRDRNAQRLASNAAPFNTPTTPPTAAGNFLYPGVGSSTFRVTTSSGVGGFGTTPTNFGTAIGLGGGGTGELPFVWSQTLKP